MGSTRSTGGNGVGTAAGALGAALLAALLAAGAATPAATQEPGGEAAWPDTTEAELPDRSGLEVDLSAAVLTPLADLVPGTPTTGALQLSAGVGLRAGVLWGLGPRIALGLGGLWVPADLDRQASTGDDAGDGVDPGGKVGEVDYLAGTADLVLTFPPVSREVRVEPYLVAGLGVRRLSVDAEGEAGDGSTDPVAALGGGFRMLLSERLLLRLEARDQVAPAELGEETRVQHDLSVSVGLGVRP
mgnify:CR=1 FL=1